MPVSTRRSTSPAKTTPKASPKPTPKKAAKGSKKPFFLVAMHKKAHAKLTSVVSAKAPAKSVDAVLAICYLGCVMLAVGLFGKYVAPPTPASKYFGLF